jgi:hypothetical protein
MFGPRRGIAKIKLFLDCRSYSLCILRKPFLSQLNNLYVNFVLPSDVVDMNHSSRHRLADFFIILHRFFCTYLYAIVGISTKRYNAHGGFYVYSICYIGDFFFSLYHSFFSRLKMCEYVN